MLNLNSFVALISPLITSFLGLLIRQALTLSKQRWASTIHFTLSAALLPPITFIITKVISGNIALSLGLVGVLPRKKIRIRNYPENNIKEFFIEKKTSSQEGRFKTTDKIKENKLAKEIFDLKYGICKPIVTVSYLREYYKVDNFRLTLDRNLKFKKYSKFSYTKEIKSNKLSLEIKSNFNYPLDKLEEYFYFERIRFSKYCEGIDMIFNQKIR